MNIKRALPMKMTSEGWEVDLATLEKELEKERVARVRNGKYRAAVYGADFAIPTEKKLEKDRLVYGFVSGGTRPRPIFPARVPILNVENKIGSDSDE